MSYIQGKRIFVTGCAGTVGHELISQLTHGDYVPVEVVGIDNNESDLFLMEQEFIDDEKLRFSLCDIRDQRKLIRLMREMDIVVHCAAYKHVVMCERSPFDAVQTNIHGVQNIIIAALENGVKRVLYTSSDKAVNPTNVMGTSKLMGERLITAANSRLRGGTTLFSSTRFGNVLGSRGSVIPVFKEQISRGGPVTVTDERMTRFIMSVTEAAQLVLDSVEFMCGGEVFITKMPIIRITDLARVMIEGLAPKYGFDPNTVNVRFIGAKPGEKLYEELMSVEETQRAIELERYYAITPAFKGIYRQINYEYSNQVDRTVATPYISSEGPILTDEELRRYLS